MGGESDFRGVSNLNEISEQRLWKLLDSISERLTGIERQLGEVVRLEERVNTHGQTLSRYGDRLDNHDRRLHEAELWQATHGDKTSVERIVTNVQSEVSELKDRLKELELKKEFIADLSDNVKDLKSNKDVSKGQKDIVKILLKWVSGILAAILVYKFTKG